MIVEDEYSPRAGDTWRWVDEAADASIGGFIGRLVERGPGHRPQAISAKDQWRLLVFAKRCAFAALRRNDPRLVRDAVIAVSLVTEDGMGDERSVWSIAGLICHAHRRVGGAHGSEVDGWIAGADQTVQAAFSRTRSPTGRGLEFDCGLREMATRAGTILLGYDHCPYAPTVDLVGAAYRVADLLEADRYHVEDITVADQLYVFPYNHVGDDEIVAADRRQVAAVKVTAIVDGERYQPIEVFLVDYPTAQDAALVAAAADRWDNDHEVQVAVVDGRVLALLGVRYRESPFTETLADLERFRPGLAAAI